MKPLPQSAACAAKCLFAVMQYMKSNGGTVTTKEINNIIQKMSSSRSGNWSERESYRTSVGGR